MGVRYAWIALSPAALGKALQSDPNETAEDLTKFSVPYEASSIDSYEFTLVPG